MDFTTAVKTCFRKYATFTVGRAARSEFWWFALFCFAGSLVLGMIGSFLEGLFSLATIIPSFAVGARRLHDLDKSGWWQLLVLIPIVGWLILIFWYASVGTQGSNRFGDDPLAADIFSQSRIPPTGS